MKPRFYLIYCVLISESASVFLSMSGPEVKGGLALTLSPVKIVIPTERHTDRKRKMLTEDSLKGIL